MCEACGYPVFRVIINLKVVSKKFNAFEKSALDLPITHYMKLAGLKSFSVDSCFVQCFVPYFPWWNTITVWTPN